MCACQRFPTGPDRWRIVRSVLQAEVAAGVVIVVVIEGGEQRELFDRLSGGIERSLVHIERGLVEPPELLELLDPARGPTKHFDQGSAVVVVSRRVAVRVLVIRPESQPR